MNSNTFNNKLILVTGHTGFKGSWLSAWLSQLGANIIGISDRVPTVHSHYELIKSLFAQDLRIDIRDSDAVYAAVIKNKPDFIFHLAGQPIVLESYKDPLYTFNTNAIGTANILDALRRVNHPCNVVMITSDKCYDNIERNYGYRETDRLGGKDPYSGSKGAAELVINSYVQSFFNKSESNVRVGVGRAGNVIGGGDWAPYRIVPDCVKAWSDNRSAEIRNPYSTRPWQHVLEPLSGYISLALALSKKPDLNGEAFNFGPPADQNHSVKELVDEMSNYWSGSKWIDKSKNSSVTYEAGLLKLNCEKALNTLGWKASLDFKKTAQWTAAWYRSYYKKGPEAGWRLTKDQIIEYIKLASERKVLK